MSEVEVQKGNQPHSQEDIMLPLDSGSFIKRGKKGIVVRSLPKYVCKSTTNESTNVSAIIESKVQSTSLGKRIWRPPARIKDSKSRKSEEEDISNSLYSSFPLKSSLNHLKRMDLVLGAPSSLNSLSQEVIEMTKDITNLIDLYSMPKLPSSLKFLSTNVQKQFAKAFQPEPVRTTSLFPPNTNEDNFISTQETTDEFTPILDIRRDNVSSAYNFEILSLGPDSVAENKSKKSLQVDEQMKRPKLSQDYASQLNPFDSFAIDYQQHNSKNPNKNLSSPSCSALLMQPLGRQEYPISMDASLLELEQSQDWVESFEIGCPDLDIELQRILDFGTFEGNDTFVTQTTLAASYR